MTGSTGVTGAAPLFAEIMSAAMRGKTPAPLMDGEGLVDVEVCALSGKRSGPHCRHRVHERFSAGREPRESCDLHVEVAVDRRNGLLAGPRCPASELRVFESYPERYASWAERAGRPVPPREWSPLCPGSDAKPRSGGVSLVYPFEGARFAFDESLSRAQQAIVLAARAPTGTPRVRFLVDGREVSSAPAPYRAPYRLVRGEHSVVAETADGRRSDAVRFTVE